MKIYTFPADYDTAGDIVVFINAAMLPIVTDLLHSGQLAARWAEDEYESGYNALSRIEADMSRVTAADILDKLEDIRTTEQTIYYSVDNGLHGATHPGYSDERVIRQQLEDLIAAIESGSDEDVVAQLQLIVAALG